jgi:hypothetical protein
MLIVMWLVSWQVTTFNGDTLLLEDRADMDGMDRK